MKIGIIADTHGHLNANIFSLFDGVDWIIHAGDVGRDEIIIELEAIAPVTAVRGNMDKSGLVSTYQECVVNSFDGLHFFTVHDLGTPYCVKKHLLDLIQKVQPQVIIFGHTHKPFVEYFGDTLYFNPGSASQARGQGKSVGLIETVNSHIVGKILPLAG